MTGIRPTILDEGCHGGGDGLVAVTSPRKHKDRSSRSRRLRPSTVLYDIALWHFRSEHSQKRARKSAEKRTRFQSPTNMGTIIIELEVEV